MSATCRADGFQKRSAKLVLLDCCHLPGKKNKAGPRPGAWARGSARTTSLTVEGGINMLTGKRATLGRSKGRTAKDSVSDPTTVKGFMRTKPLSAALQVAGNKNSPKSGGLKGKALALDGLKGPSSPQAAKNLDVPRRGLMSPRGKALTEAPAAGGLRSKMEPPHSSSSSGGDQARALASLHERHVSLQKEHASLQQAHNALQAKHRDSVGSCLVLLDQLKELQGRTELDGAGAPPGSARTAFGARPAVDRALERRGQANAAGAAASSKRGGGEGSHQRMAPLHHSAPPHKQTPGAAHAAAAAGGGIGGDGSFPVPHPLRLPDDRSSAGGEGSTRRWGGSSNRSSDAGGGASRRNSALADGACGVGASPRQHTEASPRHVAASSTQLVVNGQGSHAHPAHAQAAGVDRSPRGSPGHVAAGHLHLSGVGRHGGGGGSRLAHAQAGELLGGSAHQYERGADLDLAYEDDDEEGYEEEEGYEYGEDGLYDGDVYEDDEFEIEEDENPSEAGMSGLWGADDLENGIEEEGEDGLLGYPHPGYDEEEEAVGRLSPADVETLVEKYLHSRRRADERESENATLTQQVMAISLSEQCKDTVRTSRQPRVPPARDSHAQAYGRPLLLVRTARHPRVARDVVTWRRHGVVKRRAG